MGEFRSGNDHAGSHNFQNFATRKFTETSLRLRFLVSRIVFRIDVFKA